MVYSQDFEGYTNNDNLTGTNSFVNQSFTSFIASNLNPASGSLSMRAATSGQLGRLNETIKQDGTEFFECDLYSPAAGKNVAMLFCKTTNNYTAGNLNSYIGIIEDGSGDKHLSVYNQVGGASWKEYGALNDDTYYTIKVVLLTATTADIYVDDVLKADGVTMYATQTSVDAVHWNMGVSNTVLYVDNIDIGDVSTGIIILRRRRSG